MRDQFMAAVGAFNTGDTGPLRELFADDAVWHVGGENPYSGRFEGQDDVIGWFAKMSQLGARGEPIDFLEDEDHLVFFIRIHTDDASFDQVHANAWRIRDGRFTEGFFLVDNQEEWDAFARDRG